MRQPRAGGVPGEQAVGRIGYMFDGLGLGRQVDDAKREIRCNGCRVWFDDRELACPGCGHKRPGWSKAIHTAQVNNHLYVQAGLRNP